MCFDVYLFSFASVLHFAWASGENEKWIRSFRIGEFRAFAGLSWSWSTRNPTIDQPNFLLEDSCLSGPIFSGFGLLMKFTSVKKLIPIHRWCKLDSTNNNCHRHLWDSNSLGIRLSECSSPFNAPIWHRHALTVAPNYEEFTDFLRDEFEVNKSLGKQQSKQDLIYVNIYSLNIFSW